MRFLPMEEEVMITLLILPNTSLNKKTEELSCNWYPLERWCSQHLGGVQL